MLFGTCYIFILKWTNLSLCVVAALIGFFLKDDGKKTWSIFWNMALPNVQFWQEVGCLFFLFTHVFVRLFLNLLPFFLVRVEGVLYPSSRVFSLFRLLQFSGLLVHFFPAVAYQSDCAAFYIPTPLRLHWLNNSLTIIFMHHLLFSIGIHDIFL